MKQFINSIGGEELTIKGVTYPNDPGYQGVANGVLMANPIGNYQFMQSAITIKDKSFIIMLGITGTNNNWQVIVYDHYTNKVSNLIDTGLVADGLNDSHHMPCIYNAGDGTLFFCYTDRTAISDKKRYYSHTGPNYDVLNWSPKDLMAERDIEYPHMQTLSNGDIYDICRWYDRGAALDWCSVVWTSSDNGNNWAIKNRYIQFFSSVDERPYPLGIKGDDDVLRIFINHINFVDPISVKYLYYLESHDLGYTWQNIDNTYSQDTTSNPLDIATLQANYIAFYDENAYIRANFGCLINGNPYAVGGYDDQNNLALIYWSGSAWVVEPIICAGHTIVRREATYLEDINGTLHLYAQESVTVDELSLFTSIDNGVTWVFVEQITNANSTSVKQSFVDRNNLIAANKDYGDSSGDIYIDKLWQ